jgi:peptide/nickel transport system permease protein
MRRFLVRRLVAALGVLWAVATVVFFAIHVTGDPIAAAMASVGMTASDAARLRHSLGLDKSVIVQYWHFLGQVLRGNFGDSFQSGGSAMRLVVHRLPATLELAGAALAMTIVISFLLGVVSAYREGGIVDRLVLFVAAVGQSVPNFVAGPLLIAVFAVALHLLPVQGLNSASSVVLPAVTLALYPTAQITRVLRASILEVISADYVRAARARGTSALRVMLKHVTRNALLPVITVVGLQLNVMLGGAVIVENVFSWPGVGSLARQALLASDFPVAQSVVLVIAVMVVVVNLVTDIAYAVVDPRLRYR